MPANGSDAWSAAQALSISPEPGLASPTRRASPSATSSPDPPPPWARRSPSSRRLSTTRFARHQPPALTRALRAAHKTANNLWVLYLRLPPVQRLALTLALVVVNVVVVLFVIYSHAIFAWLAPVSHRWRALPGGWVLAWLFTFATAFPPVIGYGTSVTVAGFVYGFPHAYPIVATATVAGSLTAFYTSRTVFSGYVHRLVGADPRFVALGHVLRSDGLGMLTAVRFCPLPYSVSNGFLATVPAVRPAAFAAATALASPKLLVHVFIGSRLALIADKGDAMTAADKAVNYTSMALGGLVGLAVGWLIYHRTMARAAELALEQHDHAHPDHDHHHRQHRRGSDGSSSAGGGVARGHADFDYADVEAGLVDPEDVAALMSEDDISLWGNEEEARYRDEDEAGGQETGVVDEARRSKNGRRE
ncbi:tlg2-vesicle protein of 38 kda [Verticillium dahliae]